MAYRPGDITYLYGSAYPNGLPCEVLAVDDTGAAIKIKALVEDDRLGRMGFVFEAEDIVHACLLSVPGCWVALAWDFSMN